MSWRGRWRFDDEESVERRGEERRNKEKRMLLFWSQSVPTWPGKMYSSSLHQAAEEMGIHAF